MTIIPSSDRVMEFYGYLISAIVPRPIAFVSTLSTTGVRNLAPFSFFTVASADPPILCFAPLLRNAAGAKKDTLRNIEETGEFVVNIVSESIVEAANQCSGDYAPGVDEFTVSGLTPLPSEVVRPARVKESHVHMECKLVQVLHFGTGVLGGNLVLGEILRFHVDDSVVASEGFIASDKLRAVGRMGGPFYTRTQDQFGLERPKV